MLQLLISIIVLVLFVLLNTIRIAKEYERGVVFRFGRHIGAKGPGLFFIIPFVDKVVMVDLRVITMDVPSQEIITKDNVPLRVNAVVYFRVMDPSMATIKVENYYLATSQIAQTTLRSVTGQVELDEVLSERDLINQKLQSIIDENTDQWGIKVSKVEVKDVELPEGMKRAMARQAEAERERRAKIIAAEGEHQASQRLMEAANVISQNPVTIHLRYLQTLTEIATENNSVTVFPLPMEILEALKGLKRSEG